MYIYIYKAPIEMILSLFLNYIILLFPCLLIITVYLSPGQWALHFYCTVIIKLLLLLQYNKVMTNLLICFHNFVRVCCASAKFYGGPFRTRQPRSATSEVFNDISSEGGESEMGRKGYTRDPVDEES